MRILFCNKYNFAFSGTEAYLFDAMELMRLNSHEVALFSMADPRGAATPYDNRFVPHIDFKNHDFKKQRGWFYQAKLAVRAVYSREARRRIRGMIAEFRPDVAHVRNIYHHLTPSILWELKAHKVPVVYHLNDFKVLCPSYNFVADGEPCEACKGGEFWHVLERKCYPGWKARMTLMAEAYVHKWLGTYEKCVDCFLAPSQFVRDKFVEHGWDPAKFEVLPHFQRVNPVSKASTGTAPLLYFGRLAREKGIDDLLHAMQCLPNLRLVIAGDGPDRYRLEQMTAELGLSNVEFSGHIKGAELENAIADSSFTVLPSHAYETLGKTILESYAQARAVVASDLGSRRELVDEGETGVLYRTGDVEKLVSAIKFLSDQPALAAKMGRAGRERVRSSHAPEAHYDALLKLYKSILIGSRGSQSAARRNAAGAASTTPALRIAFIGGRGVVSKYSGIETYYEEVGERLAEMGHRITVYCRTYFTPPGKEHNGMRVVRLPTIRSKHLETLLHTLLSTFHVLTHPCDVVHYHALGPALFSFIPRLAGKKTVVTVQGLDWQRRKWGQIAAAILRLGERAAASFPNGTMVVSRTLQEHYRQTHRAETSYVPNGGLLRERRFPNKIFDWGLKPGEYVLFLGRFSPEKGCHLLVEAYERLETDVKLVITGASSYCDDYSRQLRSHAGERIKMLDWVSGDDLDELLTNAMLFVLPSELEGLSLALLDAMGAGLCVLSSDVPENREAIDTAGFTFRHGDVADLADRLRFLIANPTIREAAGQAARRRVREHYQWAEIVSQVEEVYLEIMGWKSAETLPRKPAAPVAASVPATQRKAG
jgi:glycosyltransferase involved in cell wall biosynthesis